MGEGTQALSICQMLLGAARNLQTRAGCVCADQRAVWLSDLRWEVDYVCVCVCLLGKNSQKQGGKERNRSKILEKSN